MSSETIERKSLESMLDAEPVKEPVSQPQATGVTEPKAEQGKPGEKSQAAPAAEKGKDGAAPAPDDDLPKDGTVPVAAVKSERARRQKAEAQFADLQKQIKELTAKVNGPAAGESDEDAPDPLVDPVGYARHIEAKIVSRDVARSESRMIKKVGAEDFAEKRSVFVAAVQQDPSLARQMIDADDPAEFAYEMAKKLIEQRNGSSSPSEDDMFAKFKTRLEADYDLVPKQKPNGQTPPAQQQQSAAAQRPAPRLPTSLADVPSTGPRNAGAKPIGRRTMQEMLDT